MPQQRLGNDEFLAQVGELLQSTNAATHGSVFLTQKTTASPDSTDNFVLVRATDGQTVTKKNVKIPSTKVTKRSLKPRVKLATVVAVSDLESFYIKYADVCKKGMEGLRKRDKKKAKEKAKAKKKGKAQTTT